MRIFRVKPFNTGMIQLHGSLCIEHAGSHLEIFFCFNSVYNKCAAYSIVYFANWLTDFWALSTSCFVITPQDRQYFMGEGNESERDVFLQLAGNNTLPFRKGCMFIISSVCVNIQLLSLLRINWGQERSLFSDLFFQNKCYYILVIYTLFRHGLE